VFPLMIDGWGNKGFDFPLWRSQKRKKKKNRKLTPPYYGKLGEKGRLTKTDKIF